MKNAITKGIFGGLSTDELNENLNLATEAVEKLSSTIDSIVDSILASLGDIASPTQGVSTGLKGAQINTEEELKSLANLREATFGK